MSPTLRGGGLLIVAYALLCLASLAVLWSVTEGIQGPAYEQIQPDVPKTVFWRQAVWVVLGCIALAVASRVPLEQLEEAAPVLYALAAAALILVLVAGPEVAGSRRWFALGPLRVQPSEVGKVALIVMIARLFGRADPGGRQLTPVAGSLLLAMVLAALVLREPDLGTSLVYVAVWLGLVFWFGLSWVVLLSVASPMLSAVLSFYSERIVSSPWPWGVYLLVLLAALYVARFRLLESFLLVLANIGSGVGTAYLFEGLKPYQQARILSFFQPEQYRYETGYQTIQSKIAIGSGGLFGTSYLEGTQKGLAFLPERHTDFIFSVVGEELGFVGAILLLGLFLTIILRGLSIAASARRRFRSYLALGVVAYFTFHVVVNIAITTGLLPVTGLPLPFMSYGGSNFIVSSFLLGLLVNVGSRTFET